MTLSPSFARARRRASRAFLLVAGIVPLSFGLLALGPDAAFAFWIEHQLGGTVPETAPAAPLLAYAKALLGFYVLGYASLCFALARAPERNPWMVRGVGVFLIARGFQRDFLADAMAGGFDIPASAHLGPVVFTVVFGLAIIATVPTDRRP